MILIAGPPQGLVLPSGRIVVAVGGSSIQGGRAMFSDDGGVHWEISGPPSLRLLALASAACTLKAIESIPGHTIARIDSGSHHRCG